MGPQTLSGIMPLCEPARQIARRDIPADDRAPFDRELKQQETTAHQTRRRMPDGIRSSTDPCRLYRQSQIEPTLRDHHR